jgi:hypothetical protein
MPLNGKVKRCLFTFPPLSLASARQIAEKYVAKKFPDQTLQVKTISLERITLVDRWYYVVTLEAPTMGQGAISTYEVVILTNGKIVEPTETTKNGTTGI